MYTPSSLKLVAWTICGRSRQELEMTGASREGIPKAGTGEGEGVRVTSYSLFFCIFRGHASELNTFLTWTPRHYGGLSILLPFLLLSLTLSVPLVPYPLGNCPCSLRFCICLTSINHRGKRTARLFMTPCSPAFLVARTSQHKPPDHSGVHTPTTPRQHADNPPAFSTQRRVPDSWRPPCVPSLPHIQSPILTCSPARLASPEETPVKTTAQPAPGFWPPPPQPGARRGPAWHEGPPASRE